MPRTSALPATEAPAARRLPRLYLRGVEVIPTDYYTDDRGVTYVTVRTADGAPVLDAQGSKHPYWFKVNKTTVNLSEIIRVYPE